MNVNLGYILAIIATVAWGLVVTAIKGTKTSGYLGIAISMPVGILVLLLIMLFSGTNFYPILKLPFSVLIFLLLAGIFQFPLATILYYESIRFGELSTSVPLTGIKPIFVICLVLLIGLEKINLRIFAACLIGISGAIILTYKCHRRPGAVTNIRKGIVFALLASLSWAIGDILIRIVVKHLSALLTTLLSLCSGAIFYYLFAFCKKDIKKIIKIPVKEKGRFAIHGIVSFGIGYFAFFSSMKYIGVTRAAIITAAWPIISSIVGFSFYKEHLSLSKILGILLLIGSVLLVIQ